MRLLAALLSDEDAEAIRQMCLLQGEGWDCTIAYTGEEVLSLLQWEIYDLLLLHVCLPEKDGLTVIKTLRERHIICPPRILLVGQEAFEPRSGGIDCSAPLGAEPARLFALLRLLAKKPLPALAAANKAHVREKIEHMLDGLALRRELKGYAHAAWMLEMLVPSPALEDWPLRALYEMCASEFGTTSAAVERCLRVAVESVFTQGSLNGIERVFGATIDPERGKPTNRAFLIQAAQRLRLES